MKSNPILTLPVKATAALTKQRFVTIDGTVPAAAASAFGVARTNAAINEKVAVDNLGSTVVEAGAPIAKGAAVEVGANGKAAPKAAGVTVGRALSAATADGDLFEMFLIPN